MSVLKKYFVETLLFGLSGLCALIGLIGLLQSQWLMLIFVVGSGFMFKISYDTIKFTKETERFIKEGEALKKQILEEQRRYYEKKKQAQLEIDDPKGKYSEVVKSLRRLEDDPNHYQSKRAF